MPILSDDEKAKQVWSALRRDCAGETRLFSLGVLDPNLPAIRVTETCPECGEAWCHVCDMHYAACPHPPIGRAYLKESLGTP